MAKESRGGKERGRWLKDHFKIFGSGFLITILGFVVAYQFVQPAPPRTITIATGDKSGAYYAFAQRYQKILARDGVTLAIRNTAGSVENLKLLGAQEGGVDIAFVQGGIGDPSAQPGFQSLASLYFEPLWVFHHQDLKIKRLSDLRGKKIAVGPEASGTRAIATKLLSESGVNSETATLVSLGGEKAAEALLAMNVDAVFLVLAPESPIIQDLLRRKDIRLYSFERGEAYQRINRFLSILKLPEGVVDLARDIPSRDIFLLAPAVNLVVQEDFHPALVDLLLGAAMEVHSSPGLFQDYNEFPSQKYLDFPQQKDAQRFFRVGPAFLRKYLPFWLATFIERSKVMILPLVTLLIPFIRFFPSGFRWRMRSRIYRWYRNLEEVDYKAQLSIAPDEIRSWILELEKIEKEIMRISVPLSYAGELYNLRIHISHVRESLKKNESVLCGEADNATGNAKKR